MFISLIIALSIGPAIAHPCHAQDVADIPVLRQYGGRDWIYFATASDEAMIFENLPNDGSNVLVAAERSSAGKRIRANTEIWTDNLGRLHTVGVLKLQLEFNAYLKEQKRIWGPSLIVGTSVAESGILDFKTLLIPLTKLEPRVRRLTDRVAEEYAAADRIAATDPGAAALKRAYASYFRERASIAKARVDELYSAIAAVPLARVRESDLPSASGRPSGLRGLEIPIDERNFLNLVSQDSREVRFVTVHPTLQEEMFLSEFIDPAGMTPTIADDLRKKVAAADEAVNLAENLCRELLTPPCP